MTTVEPLDTIVPPFEFVQVLALVTGLVVGRFVEPVVSVQDFVEPDPGPDVP
jgi:hypothetical protein